MKLSEYLMAKALQHDNFELTKMAQNLHGTNEDVDVMVKEAVAPMLGGLVRAGSSLLKNRIIKNTAISTGVGAAAGAMTAEKGQRLSGALKGGMLGTALGAGGTVGSNLLKATSKGATVTQSLSSQFSGLKNTFANLGKNYQKGVATAQQAATEVGKSATAPTSPQ